MTDSDPTGSVDASPNSAPRSEIDPALAIVRAASPWRLAGKVVVFVFVPGAIAGGYFGWRAHERTEHARHAPMITVPAGSFVMGDDKGPPDERPARSVTLSAFELDRGEVTVAAYALCLEAGKCTPPIRHDHCNWGRDGRDEHPINCITWYQAKQYCEWTGKRLPTEAEWEYAARGTDGRLYPWGDGPPGPTLLNVCDGECKRMIVGVGSEQIPTMFDESDGFGDTAPVESFPAGKSPFGLFDMAGNVWEWTASPLCPYAQPDCTSSRDVTRGGGWGNAYRSNVESTTRGADDPTAWSDEVGVRCAR